MKTIAQILLVILFVLFFSVTLLLATAKYAFLNHGFWIRTFERNNVYETMSGVLKNWVNDQVGKEGGSVSDVTVITDLITRENTKDFTDNNLKNMIDFANGKAGELIVYIPISRAPKDLLPKRIGEMNNEMTVSQLTDKFGVVGLDKLPFKEISKIGETIFYALLVAASVLTAVMIFLVLSTEPGSRFIALGVSFILTGVGLLILTNTGSGTLFGNNFETGNFNTVFALAIVKPLTTEAMLLWEYISYFLLASGIALTLLRKPDLS